MERFKVVFWALCMGVSGLSVAQTSNRYMVFFTDKDATPYSIESPDEFLSQRSIDRRERHNIGISAEDLPVDPAYVSALNDVADVYFTTRWFNGALVQTLSTNLPIIEALSFVSRVELVALGAVLTREQQPMPTPPPAVEADTTGFSTDFQNELIGGDEMHADGFRGEGILVAVMDGGFRRVHEFEVFRHLFDENRLVATRDFVTDSYDPFQFSGHGTAVLSCIAGYRSEHIKGLAHNADIALFVTEEVSTEYRVEEYNWLFAAEMADSMGVDVINTSLGYTDFDLASMNYSYSAMDGQTAVTSRAAEIAFSKGMFLVTSNGNLGNSSWQYMSAPADAPNSLAVGALTSNLLKTTFSSIGPTFDSRIKPDVATLGSDVTVFSGSSFSFSNGTSFASPLVAGLVAGLWQQHPEWTNTQLLRAIRLSSSRAGDPNFEMGYGIPNYRLEENETVLAFKESPSDIIAYPNPVTSNVLTLDFRGTDFQLISGHLINTHGQVLQVFDAGSNNPTVEVDLSPVSDGLYYLKLVGDNDTHLFKVIKR
ncbi:MAG: S8 family serine peptidase [Bacteroidota bacterium]